MFDLTVPDDVIILNVEEANLNRHMQTFNEKRARSQLRAVEGSVSRLNEKLQLTKQGMKKNDVSAMLSRENTTDGSHHHYHDKRNSDRNDGCSWSPVPPRKKRKLSPEDSSFSGAELEKHELLTPGSVSGKRRSAHKHRQGKDNDAENEETLQELVQVESGTSKIQFQPLTRSSRFALYMLRQELTESPIDTSQHSPDYLAIRQCSVQCKLSPKAMSPFSRYNYPLSESYVQRILSRLTM